MGIFSNRCDALVNPVTGRALAGKALEEARKVKAWPRCGHSVKKTAKCCSMCGAPARGGWVKCPHCGVWVGNDSHFCWNCNTPLNPDERVAIAGGVWHREEGVFAQRFEADAFKAFDDRALQIQEGTVAILISGGAIEDVLDAGRFKLESTARTINWFGNPPNRSALLLEAGACILPIKIDGLSTKAAEGSGLAAGATVDFYGEAVVRFSGGKAAATAFVENAMKDRRCLTFDELTGRLAALTTPIVRRHCLGLTLEELVSDADFRGQLHSEMGAALAEDFEQIGLDLVRLSLAEFNSPAYSELVVKNAQLDEARRRAEHEAAMRRFSNAESLARIKDAQEFRLAKEAMDEEFRLKELEREDRWNQLMTARKDEQEADRRARDMAAKARAEKEQDERRVREAAEKVRRQKEEDEDRIRKWALMEEEIQHAWSQEEAQRKREWADEKARHQHETEIAEMVQRAREAQSEKDWAHAYAKLLHDQKMDAATTEHLIAKAAQIASGEISVKELHDEYERRRQIAAARTRSTVREIEREDRDKDHAQEIKETRDWIKVKNLKRMIRRNPTCDPSLNLDPSFDFSKARGELLDRIQAASDPAIKKMLEEEYRTHFIGTGD